VDAKSNSEVAEARLGKTLPQLDMDLSMASHLSTQMGRQMSGNVGEDFITMTDDNGIPQTSKAANA